MYYTNSHNTENGGRYRLFALQWNIENLIAPIICSLISNIMMWFFVQLVEHIKKPHFFVDKS